MTAAGDGRFADLAPRVVSAVILGAVGVGAVWLGGWWFAGLVALAAALIGWELFRMLGTGPLGAPVWLAGALVGVAVLAAGLLPVPAGLLLLLLPGLAALATASPHRVAGGLYLLVVCFGAHAFVMLRLEFGLLWVVWLVLIVIASDVAGYFAGRLIGGPKLWPRVSPKKTWSGTVAGWIAAVAASLPFLGLLGVGAGLLALALVVAMAGQAGDIAESALKRRVGVKDSSALIPGHGGVMDRFDAMLGAALAVLIAGWLGLLPASGV